MCSIKNTLALCLIGCVISVSAQDLKIKQVEFLEDGSVSLTYDLLDNQTDRKYTVYLYSSTDNYIQPLARVSGDVGIEVAVGGNKKIKWDAQEELGGDFKGDVSLEIKAKIYVPFIEFDGFENYKIVKRGIPYELTWSGGRGDNVLLFELYKGEQRVKVFDQQPNVGNTSLTIPVDVKPGSYRLKVSDMRNREEVIFSEPFEVKRKVALWIKSTAGLLVGGVVGYLAGSATAEEKKIGLPPLPDGN